MPKKSPRPFQKVCVDRTMEDIHAGIKNCLLVVPVAGGKTYIINMIIEALRKIDSRVRVCCICHSATLINQLRQELFENQPDADVGLYGHTLGEKRLYNDITCSMIQSVYNKISEFNRCPDVIIIDETHMVSHNEQTQYRQFINAVRQINPNSILIGLTGSPWRSDSGRLDEGENSLFDNITYEISLQYMFEEGWLVKPKVPMIQTVMDTTGVKTRGGDYIVSQLERAVDTDDTNVKCAIETEALSRGRRRLFAMTVSIQHCEHIRDALRNAGIQTEMVHSRISKEDFNRNMAWFKDDSPERKCLVNVGQLNVGFNHPPIDCLINCRPMRSPVLYMQFSGRGLRPVYASGYDLETKDGRLAAIANGTKPDVLFLDFGNTIKELGPLDLLDVRKKGNKKSGDEPSEAKEVVAKTCPACGELCLPSQAYCFNCSYCFINITPAAEKNHAILSEDIPPRELSVIAVSHKRHVSKNQDGMLKTPTLRVDYVTMAGRYSEWICFEHPNGSYPRNRAIAWHKDRMPDTPAPDTIEEALQIKYPEPSSIFTKPEGKYDKITGYDFSVKDEDKIDLSDFEELQI